jgi:hypothetical protein
MADLQTPRGKPALYVLGAVVVMAASVAIAVFKRGTGSHAARLLNAHALGTMIVAAPFWCWSIYLNTTTHFDSGVVVFALAAASAWRQMRRPHASAQRWYTLCANELCALAYALGACIVSFPVHASLPFLQAYFIAGAALWCANGIVGWHLVNRVVAAETEIVPLVI